MAEAYVPSVEDVERVARRVVLQVLDARARPMYNNPPVKLPLTIGDLSLVGAIEDQNVKATAAIAYSKLNLALGIVNADVSAAAAIAYSKLALTGSVVAGDMAFNVLKALAAGKTVDGGSASGTTGADGSLTVATGLTSVEGFSGVLSGVARGGVSHVSTTGGDVVVICYDQAGALATTAVTVKWMAKGT